MYSIQWVNGQSGKKGYSPAVRGGWRNRDADAKTISKDYLPLTDAVVRQHLEETHIIGVYPLLPGDTCWFLACDFDGKAEGISVADRPKGTTVEKGMDDHVSEHSGWALDVLEYLTVCERYEIPAYLERSQSGMGAHVWIFFVSPVSAALARRLGEFLLRETMAMRAGMDLASYDRFFPSQDLIPKGGFGNLIALPLQKRLRVLGHTEFLDRQMCPWPDQWVFLSSIKRLSLSQLEGVIEQSTAAPLNPGSHGMASKHLLDECPVPPQIICTFSAALAVEKIGLPSWFLSEIKHLASFHNPAFYERQRLRLSTFRTPRFIKCYEEDSTCLYLPRGLLEDLQKVVQQAGSQLSMTDLRHVPDTLSLNFSGTLTSLQEQAVSAMLLHDQGILVAPPGMGKTVMACCIAAQRNIPVLVLVHRKPLLDQWRLQLMNVLGLAAKEIGQIGSGKDTRTRIVDLAMIQTLKKVEAAKDFFADYGLLIVDECHHLPAFSFESCVKQAPIRYVLGLTATPYRRDGLQNIIVMQSGPIRHTISDRQSEADRKLALQLVVRETDFIYPASLETPIQEVFRALTHDVEQTRVIGDDVLAAVSHGHRCLVLSEWKEHCRALSEQFLALGLQSFVLDGGVRKKAREATLETIRTLPHGEDLLLVSTGQYLGEGFDCPQIDTLFLTFPVSFKGKLVQYVGRLLRSDEGKTLVRVYDYADVQVPVLKKMFEKRRKTYQTLGFTCDTAPQP